MSTATFEVDDLLLEQRIAEVHAVPTHDVAVCAVKQAQRDSDGYRSALWLFPLDGSAEARSLTAGTAQDMQPRWSPDGRCIAFLSDRAGLQQVFLIQPDGGEARQLSHFKGGVTACEWSPDGRRLLLTAIVHVDPEARGAPSQLDEPRSPDAPELVWRLPYKLDGVGYLLDQQIHLFTLDVDSGQERQLTQGAFEVRSAAWSPDGRRIVYSRTREARTAHRTDLWVVAADGAHPRQLTHALGNATVPRWSPDGHWIVCCGNRDEGDAKMQLWLVRPDGSGLRPLGDPDGVEVVPSSPLCWSEDGAQLRVLLAQRGRQHLVSLSVPEGERRTLVDGDRQLGTLAVGRSRLAFTWESGDSPLELCAADLDGRNEQPLSRLNSWWHEREPLQAQVRHFRVPDGRGGMENVDAWLIQARDSRTPLPVLVDVHGGPASYADLSFQNHAFWPVLCARGWLIVVPNTAGSSSYGREFAERLRGRWGELDLPQHLAIVQALQAEGLADDRVAITGSSYGGYMAAWAIAHSRAFRAAVVCSPVTNLETHYGTSDSGYYSDPYDLCGTPRIDRHTSRRLSPMTDVEHARTPTLILQGKEDERCPKCQSEELFASLMCATGTPCEMVLYPGGNHHVLKEGKPSHRLDGVRRIVEWVQRWVDQPLDENGARNAGGQRSDGH